MNGASHLLDRLRPTRSARAWSLLCSAYEPASGTDQYYRYRAVFETPKISLYLEDDLLLTVVDHKPDTLTGGHIAMRNMTPGGKYRIRNIQIKNI